MFTSIIAELGKLPIRKWNSKKVVKYMDTPGCVAFDKAYGG